jgi:hypothetical protein
MGNVIDVYFEGFQVGSITFEEAPRNLTAHRTAAGFALGLPFTVRLKMKGTGAPQPLLSGMSGELFVQARQGQMHRLGYARCDEYFLGSVPEGQSSGRLLWIEGLPGLAFYEEIRAGNPPEMRITLRAEVCYLVPFGDPAAPMPVPVRQIRTNPWTVMGTVDVRYPTEVWGQMLRALEVLDIVFVQVPLPSDPPSGWESVWREVAHAREAFERGGETGWTACVVAIRRALEAWDALEPERMWPGWQRPSEAQRDAWAKTDRLVGLRWHLHQAAHPAAHTGPEGWSRNDARLMLSTLSALLALRNP